MINQELRAKEEHIKCCIISRSLAGRQGSSKIRVSRNRAHSFAQNKQGNIERLEAKISFSIAKVEALFAKSRRSTLNSLH